MIRFFTTELLIVTTLYSLKLVTGDRATLDRDIDFYSHCNDVEVSFPIKWLPDLLAAFALHCTQISDPDCMRQCLVLHYPNTPIKSDQPSSKEAADTWVRKMTKDLKKENPKFREKIDKVVDELNSCYKDGKFFKEPGPDDRCPDSKAFKDCFDAKFRNVCKSKKGGSSTDFLNN